MKKGVFLCLLFVYFAILRQTHVFDDNLHIFFCDVGQGDAILIQHGGKQVIIDGGPDSSFLECLGQHMPYYDRTIDLVIVTHADSDHVAGLVEVLKRYKVDHIMTTPVMKDAVFYWLYLESVRASQAKIHFPVAGERISIGNMQLSVLWPQDISGDTRVFLFEDNADILEENAQRDTKENGNTNSGSIVIKLKFGALNALFTGDLEIEQELSLVTLGKLGHVDVLKVGHHGSGGSTSARFLEEITPDIAVSSIGEGNSYGHPARRVIDLLEEKGVISVRTDEDGAVEVVSDGGTFQVKIEY